MEEIRVEIRGHTNPPGKALAIHSKALDANPTPADHGYTKQRYYDVKIEGIGDGTATVIITHPVVEEKWRMRYFHEGKWADAKNSVAKAHTVHGDIPVGHLTKTPIVIGTH